LSWLDQFGLPGFTPSIVFTPAYLLRSCRMTGGGCEPAPPPPPCRPAPPPPPCRRRSTGCAPAEDPDEASELIAGSPADLFCGPPPFKSPAPRLLRFPERVEPEPRWYEALLPLAIPAIDAPLPAAAEASPPEDPLLLLLPERPRFLATVPLALNVPVDPRPTRELNVFLPRELFSRRRSNGVRELDSCCPVLFMLVDGKK